MRKPIILLLGIIIVAIFFAGCQAVEVKNPGKTAISGGTATTVPTSQPSIAASLQLAQTSTGVPTASPTRIPSATPTEEPAADFPDLDCGEAFCQAPWSGLLARPIGLGGAQTIDPSYPYASTKNGTMDSHHGVEFLNGAGTPVLAAQRGVVVYAGTDETTVLGPYTGFYGNVVIIHHPALYEGRDLYTLYAHLSVIEVRKGQPIDQGVELGRVGATGAADGSHLHFEVRLDENDYDHTINPVLWLAPLNTPETGETASVAGLILARWGEPLGPFQLSLEKVGPDGAAIQYFYPQTYDRRGVNGHPALSENFALGDLTPGEYRLSFISSSFYQVRFTLAPGSLGFIKLQLD